MFKRICSEYPEILRGFLNGVLPFEDESEFITSLESLPGEQVPDIPLLKNSIVEVRCKDASGRQFIVEMQMAWTNAFLQRVLSNASKGGWISFPPHVTAHFPHHGYHLRKRGRVLADRPTMDHASCPPFIR